MPNTWIDKHTDDPEKRLEYAVAKLALAAREVSGKRGRTYLRDLKLGKELDGLVAAFQRLKNIHTTPELGKELIKHEPGSCPACLVL